MFRDTGNLRVRIGRKTVDCHHARKMIDFADVCHMAEQIRQSARERLEILRAERIFGKTTVHLQGAHRRHEDDCIRHEPRHAALDIQKFFRSEVGTEARLGHGIVGVVHRTLRRDDRIAAVRDIGERTAVHECRGALQRLYKVGFESVAQERRHSTRRPEIPRRHRVAAVGVTDDHTGKPFPEVGK